MTTLRPCIQLLPNNRTCGTPTVGNRCPTHQQPRDTADNRRRNRKTVAHGVKRAHFQKLRTKRLDQAGGYCELHLDRHCTITATTVHLDPALNGDHDAATLDDLRAACAHCHGALDGARAHR